MDLGPHAVYILASYAVVALVLVGLAIWLVVDGMSQRRILDDLEARGARRRSRRSAGSDE